jgi:cob(I)alamin adenosyltransferase
LVRKWVESDEKYVKIMLFSEFLGRLCMDKGLIQVYTGDGKGKTTAAIGQGIRAVGTGNRVYMVQFLKSTQTGELKTIERLYPDFKVFRFEGKHNFVWTLDEAEKEELKGEINTALEFVKNSMDNNECDIIILDEIMAVLSNRLAELKDVLEILKGKPENIEVVLTGRNVPKEIEEIADYVSLIKCVKHPLQKGIQARKGIEY